VAPAAMVEAVEAVVINAVTKGTKAIFPNCNKLVVHAASDCFMLPANKDKVPTWYKPPQLD
jgi:hypothetical protein